MTKERKPVVVLLVEDDAFVRALAIEILSEIDVLAVLTASDAAKAISLLRVRPDVRVVITDVTIPGLTDGVALAHILIAQWPEVGVIITSAVGMPDNVPLGAHVLLKPYRADEIRGLVRVMLG